MVTHAANPFAIRITDNIYKIFFTSRDVNNRSFISSLIMDMADACKVLEINNQPELAPGELGMFDDSGTAMGFYLETADKKLLYYLGWNLKVTVPWLNTIGLAVFNEQTKKFEKVSRAPLLDRSNEDPFSISYPSILLEDGLYRMWYGSNLSWGKIQDDMQHIIKYATSKDGISWHRTNETMIGLKGKHEYALSKPFVIKDGDTDYKMWFSYRASELAQSYRIGYATSLDGLVWERKDEEVGIDVSKNGWDSEMICYPFVFDYNGDRYMLYNGNGYGKTGFGIAVLEK
jgi:hypothetical protein